MTMRKIGLTAGLAFAAFLAQAVNWDNALIRGTTPGGKLFFEPGEGISSRVQIAVEIVASPC